MGLFDKARELAGGWHSALRELDGDGVKVLTGLWALLYFLYFGCTFFLRLLPYERPLAALFAAVYLAAWFGSSWRFDTGHGFGKRRAAAQAAVLVGLFLLVLVRAEPGTACIGVFWVGVVALWVAHGYHDHLEYDGTRRGLKPFGGAALAGLLAFLGWAVAAGWTLEVARRSLWRNEAAHLTPRFRAEVEGYLRLPGTPSKPRKPGESSVITSRPAKVIPIDKATRAVDPFILSCLPPKVRASRPEEVGTVILVEWTDDRGPGTTSRHCTIAYFPVVAGEEWKRVQQRFLAPSFANRGVFDKTYWPDRQEVSDFLRQSPWK